MSNQGSSYALNAPLLGDDPNYLDHSFDLLLMINTFRHRMKPPFIGVAHSMGCAQLAYLASIHPRLFHSLILIDPVIQARPPPGPNAALFSSLRRDTWPSRAKAEAQISRNPFFANMDPRALSLFLQYALRDVPDGSVVLSTPKAQEAWTFIRSNLHPLSENTEEGRRVERLLNPDAEPFSLQARAKFTRPEMLGICEALPGLRPRTFLLYGEGSHINIEEMRDYHVNIIGSGRGGNGGVKEGGVTREVLEDCGHMCVFEKPTVIARSVAEWLSKERLRWEEEKVFWDMVDTGKSKNDRKELSDEWIKAVREEGIVKRAKAGEKARL
jgi:pimeloyl-ACP methyl ester carboxylesterase